MRTKFVVQTTNESNLSKSLSTRSVWSKNFNYHNYLSEGKTG